jgi:hypothetical protein
MLRHYQFLRRSGGPTQGYKINRRYCNNGEQAEGHQLHRFRHRFPSLITS